MFILYNKVMSYEFVILLVNKKPRTGKTIKTMTITIIMYNCNAFFDTPKCRPLLFLQKYINTVVSVVCIVFIKYEGNTIWIKGSLIC